MHWRTLQPQHLTSLIWVLSFMQLTKSITKRSEQVRVLQVVGAMNRAGVETWLMHILRNIDRSIFKMDFLVHSPEASAYDSEIHELGARTLYCAAPHSPIAYARAFCSLQHQYGPYDVVHSHLHAFSGFVMRLAYMARIPKRITHSHLDSSREDKQAGFGRKLYLTLCRRWIEKYATTHLAVSDIAAVSLFGINWRQRTQLVPCGIDVASFESPIDGASVRAELGFRPDDFVLGHVGRSRSRKIIRC